MSYHADDYLHEQEIPVESHGALCVLCESELNHNNWKEVEIVQVTGQVVRWNLCNWCAQVVKETFTE